MGIIKFILVLLLCVPVAYFSWSIINSLMDNIKKQQQVSDEIRIRKAAFQKPERSLHYDERTGFVKVKKETNSRVNSGKNSNKKNRSSSSAKRRRHKE